MSAPFSSQCIDIAEWFNFNLGNAISHIWQYSSNNSLDNLKAADWYLNREIERVSKGGMVCVVDIAQLKAVKQKALVAGNYIGGFKPVIADIINHVNSGDISPLCNAADLLSKQIKAMQ